MEEHLARLRAYVSNFVELSDEDWALYSACHVRREIAKGDYLLDYGEVCNHVSWVAQGSFMYTYYKEGEDRAYEFVFENMFVTEYSSFLQRRPSAHRIRALEAAVVYDFDYDNMQHGYVERPLFERMGRRIAEELFIWSESRVQDYIRSDPESLYIQLIETRPAVLQRVAQKHIASYLGIKPESLSRIRKRLAQG